MKSLLTALSAMVLAAAGLSVAPAARAGDVSRIAVICAYPPEAPALMAALHDTKTVTINGNPFTTGTMGGKPVVLMMSGVSMVNAAMSTQLLLDHFHVRAIVFSGIAGGVDPSLHVGDVVAPDQWAQSMEVVLTRKTADGFDKPSLRLDPSSRAPYGMMAPRGIMAGNADTPFAFHDSFPADPKLIALARQVAPSVHLKACNAAGLCLEHAPQVVVGGVGVSAPAFVDNAEYRSYLFDTFHARATDMESAAVVQVAYANEVPAIIFRSLSDLAGGDGGANQMKTFMGFASDNSAAVVEAFVAAMPEQ